MNFAVIGKGFTGTYNTFIEAVEVMIKNGDGEIFISMTHYNVIDELMKQASEVDKKRQFDWLQRDIRRIRTSLNMRLIKAQPQGDSTNEDETRC